MGIFTPENITQQQDPAEAKIEILDTREQMIAAINALQEATKCVVSLTDATTLNNLRNTPESASRSGLQIVFDPELPNFELADFLKILSGLKVICNGKTISLLEYLNKLEVFQYVSAPAQLKPVQLSIKGDTAQRTIGKETAELKPLRQNFHILNYLIVCSNDLWKAIQAVCAADKIEVKKPELVRSYVLLDENVAGIASKVTWFTSARIVGPESKAETLHTDDFAAIKSFLKSILGGDTPDTQPRGMSILTPILTIISDLRAGVMHSGIPAARMEELLKKIECFKKTDTWQLRTYEMADNSNHGQQIFHSVISEYLEHATIFTSSLSLEHLGAISYIRNYFTKVSLLDLKVYPNNIFDKNDQTFTIEIDIKLVQD